MADSATFDLGETLRNGLTVRIRALRADDRQRLAAAFRLLDRDTVYRRLFAFKNELTDADLDRLISIEPGHAAALVVTTGAGSKEIIIGSGRYVASGTSAAGRTAEVAFVVEEDYQNLGIAGRLLGHLAALARADGFAALEADVLEQNGPMLAVFARCGLPMSSQRDQGIVHLTLSL